MFKILSYEIPQKIALNEEYCINSEQIRKEYLVNIKRKPEYKDLVLSKDCNLDRYIGESYGQAEK